MLAYQHWTWFTDVIDGTDPHLLLLTFLVSVASYTVLVL